MSISADGLHDQDAQSLTADRATRQQAIAALITQAVLENGIDYGAGDAVSVYAETIGYRIIDAAGQPRAHPGHRCPVG